MAMYLGVPAVLRSLAGESGLSHDCQVGLSHDGQFSVATGCRLVCDSTIIIMHMV